MEEMAVAEDISIHAPARGATANMMIFHSYLQPFTIQIDEVFFVIIQKAVFIVPFICF